MPSCEGAWTPEFSGGTPPGETWHANPQFAIHPTVEGATYKIELVRHPQTPSHRICLWVMKADSMEGRKREFEGMVEKTKLNSGERRSLSLELPLRKGGLPYIAFCATQAAGLEGTFTMTVTSVEDPDVRLVPLQPDASAMAQAVAKTAAPSGDAAKQPRSAPHSAAVPMLRAQSTFAGAPPDNKPVVETIGQGLSKKLQADADVAVASALQACEASGGKFEDGSFPPTEASLGASAAALGVASWRRPDEIEPSFGSSGSLFAKAEGVGLQLGALQDEWLLGALNVMSNVEVAERIFVDSSHGHEHGFYVVRLFAEDPNSDEDWSIVIVDDRLPCDASGALAFGRGAKPGALWASIVEKAVAKRYGSYSALATVPDASASGSSGEATLRGLELVTGGKARELPMPPPQAANAERETSWNVLKECLVTNQVVCARCDSNSAVAAEAERMGIVPDKTYCIIGAGDFMGPGSLMRLRGFAGDPEWQGKWSDNDNAWTSMLRQQLAYSKDQQDGTFWISYVDFTKHFSHVFATRVVDDRWTRLTVKSRWMDATAGGSMAHVSFRDNYQWLLTMPRETELTLQLSLPDPRLSASVGELATPLMGLVVLQANPLPDARRRKLRVADPGGEVVFHAEPRLTRRLQVSTRLPATSDGQPYVVVPYLATPGAESKFSLTVLLDDTNDDGVADIVLEPMLPNPPNREDWYTKRVEGMYSRAAACPNQPGFSSNTRVPFSLEKAGGGEARVFVCLETLGINRDMRSTAGMQMAPNFPAIGLALLPSAAEPVGDRLPANAIELNPSAVDGVWLEATLPTGGAVSHVVVPFLAPGQPPTELQYALTIYSECPLADPQYCTPTAAGATLLGTGGLWECEQCSVEQGGHGPTCPYRVVVEKMAKIEAQLDERIAFLDEMLAAPAHGFAGGVIPPSVAISDGLGLSYG